jgi:hypothetical protein
MKYHTTKNGKRILLKDMTIDHLKNTILWIERKAANGITVRSGGGSTAEDIYYDEETYSGEKALKLLNYYSYKAELSKRTI